MRSGSRWTLAIVPLLLILIGAIWGLPLALFAFRPVGETLAEAGKRPPAEAFILVQRGASATSVIQLLEKAGFPLEASKLVMLGKIQRTWKSLKTGEYRVTSQQTPVEILKTLTSGISVRHVFTVPEGENMYEVAARLEQAGLADKAKVLQLCRDPNFIKKTLGNVDFSPPTLEGFLFPDTYSFNRLMTAEDMLEQMHRRFKQVWQEVKSKPNAVQNLTQYQTVTLASMIEKETGAPEERPLISSVFHNRLRKKMKLQSDPTTIYGIWERYDGNIHKSDLLTPTAYNTYTVPALPAGPISNPGQMALEAALNPAISDYLFFVSKNEGHHIFTKTYGEHQNAVKDFQLNSAARAGKSWRDLKQSGQKN
jgi:UPF0755 protein